jgi:hypothetical protein
MSAKHRTHKTLLSNWAMAKESQLSHIIPSTEGEVSSSIPFELFTVHAPFFPTPKDHIPDAARNFRIIEIGDPQVLCRNAASCLLLDRLFQWSKICGQKSKIVRPLSAELQFGTMVAEVTGQGRFERSVYNVESIQKTA